MQTTTQPPEQESNWGLRILLLQGLPALFALILASNTAAPFASTNATELLGVIASMVMMLVTLIINRSNRLKRLGPVAAMFAESTATAILLAFHGQQYASLFPMALTIVMFLIGQFDRRPTWQLYALAAFTGALVAVTAPVNSFTIFILGMTLLVTLVVQIVMCSLGLEVFTRRQQVASIALVVINLLSVGWWLWVSLHAFFR
jgi:hypothetical protein